MRDGILARLPGIMPLRRRGGIKGGVSVRHVHFKGRWGAWG